MEKEKVLEIKSIIGASLFAVATLGIVETRLYIPSAITTPIGIIYFYDQNNQQIQAHEQVHWDRYQSGELDFWKYLTNKKYRCEEETIANTQAGIHPYNGHPACNY